MKHLKFINFTAVSEELTKGSSNIRANRIPTKYKEAIEDLDFFIEMWLIQTKKRLNPEPKIKAIRNTSGLKRGRN